MNEKKEKILSNFILDDYLKEDIAINVSNSGKLNKLYWLQLFLSGVIATLGLLQGSVPVVIGVMLIAPLLRPIQSLSFSLATAHSKKSWEALKNIFFSILLVVFSAIIISYLIPFKIENSEIISRTNPNILDFFIAAFSAIIAFLALVYKKKLSDSIAGVAMAASLLPPLSVVGIEIAYGNYFLAWGSLLLFITNLIAIILIGILLFFIFGFKPHGIDNKSKFKKNILILILFVLLISVPLFSSIMNLKEDVDDEIFFRDRISKSILKDKIKIKNIYIKNQKDNVKIIMEGDYYDDNSLNLIEENLKIINNNFSNFSKKNSTIEFNLNLVKKIEI